MRVCLIIKPQHNGLFSFFTLLVFLFFNCGLYSCQLATVEPADGNRSARN